MKWDKVCIGFVFCESFRMKILIQKGFFIVVPIQNICKYCLKQCIHIQLLYLTYIYKYVLGVKIKIQLLTVIILANLHLRIIDKF